MTNERGKREPLEDLHERWCAEIASSLGSHLAPETATRPGYEHPYVTTGLDHPRLVVVCPWHWPAYSHYQFWELAAVPFLARSHGYTDWCLVTNDAWTAWIPPALTRLYGAVITGDNPPIDDIRRWLDGPANAPVLSQVRARGRIDLGHPTKGATTVSIKERIEEDAADQVRPGKPVPSVLDGVPLRPAFLEAGKPGIIFAKGFRNPDPIHEAKMLAGRAYLCPPDRHPIVVIDGQWGEAPELIAAAGAHACTPDRLRTMLES